MLYIVAALVVVIDQITKELVRSSMLVGDSTPLIPGIVYLTHVKNPGAAFGILPNYQMLFYVVALAVVVLLLVYYRRLDKVDRVTSLSFGLVTGGATGNLIDRVSAGVVTDFIDFRFWPVFNIADTAIVVGVILLGIVLTRGAGQEQVEAE